MVLVSKCALAPRLVPVGFTEKTETFRKNGKVVSVLLLNCFVFSSFSSLISYPKLKFIIITFIAFIAHFNITRYRYDQMCITFE